jgi:hypothetical protein
MELDVYRSCSFAERREVLGVFWRAQPSTSPKITEGAIQYGPVAAIFVLVICVELGLLTGLTLAKGSSWGWALLVVTLLGLASLWLAVERVRSLRGHPRPS